MKKSLILLISALLFGSTLIAQQLPVGAGGIVNTYDASGNTAARIFL